MTFSRHLVIGGHGLIGTAVCAELVRRDISHLATTRRRDDGGIAANRMIYFDLFDIAKIPELPEASCVYLIAGMPGFPVCEGNPTSWHVNVDAQVALARRYRNSFVVFVSSDCVEWAHSAYAAQKRYVENYIDAIAGGKVRPKRVAPERAEELARVIVDVGVMRKAGVTRWV